MKRILLFLTSLFLLAACGPKTVSITLPDGFTVKAALARSPEEHAKGLMFVKHLPENKGMLFVFDENQPQAFWMKNTLIDLDMVFLDDKKQVTSVEAEVPHSYTYTPEHEVARAYGYGKYVLELSAKTAAKHGVQNGALLKFDL